MTFESLEKSKIEIKSCLYCNDIYDDDCSLRSSITSGYLLNLGPDLLKISRVERREEGFPLVGIPGGRFQGWSTTWSSLI